MFYNSLKVSGSNPGGYLLKFSLLYGKIKIFAFASAENSINAAKPEKIVDCTADFETELSFQ